MIRTNTSKVLRVTRHRKIGIITHTYFYVKLVGNITFRIYNIVDCLINGCVPMLYRYNILETYVTSKPLYRVKHAVAT